MEQYPDDVVRKRCTHNAPGASEEEEFPPKKWLLADPNNTHITVTVRW